MFVTEPQHVRGRASMMLQFQMPKSPFGRKPFCVWAQVRQKWEWKQDIMFHFTYCPMVVRVHSPTSFVRTWYISSTPICQVGSSGGSTHRSLHFRLWRYVSGIGCPSLHDRCGLVDLAFPIGGSNPPMVCRKASQCGGAWVIAPDAASLKPKIN